MEKIIQNYKIMDKIGEGSFAKVKRCQNLVNGQFYAIKIYNKFLLLKRKKLKKNEYVSDLSVVFN